MSGTGHFLHTYKKNGTPLPSFEGEPVPVKIGDLKTFSEEIWDNLNEDNKISLVCRSIDLKTGETETVLFNKNTK